MDIDNKFRYSDLPKWISTYHLSYHNYFLLGFYKVSNGHYLHYFLLFWCVLRHYHVDYSIFVPVLVHPRDFSSLPSQSSSSLSLVDTVYKYSQVRKLYTLLLPNNINLYESNNNWSYSHQRNLLVPSFYY